jgi:hypothetical protein
LNRGSPQIIYIFRLVIDASRSASNTKPHTLFPLTYSSSQHKRVSMFYVLTFLPLQAFPTFYHLTLLSRNLQAMKYVYLFSLKTRTHLLNEKQFFMKKILEIIENAYAPNVHTLSDQETFNYHFCAEFRGDSWRIVESALDICCKLHLASECEALADEVWQRQ